MAVSPMMKVTLITSRDLLEDLLLEVQQLQHVQVNDLAQPDDTADKDEQPIIQQFDAKHQVQLTDDEALQYLAKRQRRIERAIEQHERHLPKPSFWQKIKTEQPSVTFEEIEAHGNAFNEYAVVNRANKLTKRLQSIQEELQTIKIERDYLEKWKYLEVTPKMASTFQFVKIVIGTVPSTQEDPFIKFIKQHEDLEHDVVFMNDIEYGVLIFLKDLENEAVLSELKEYQFVPFDYDYDKLPMERIFELDEQAKQLETNRQSIIDEMSQTHNLLEELKLQSDYVENLHSREKTKLLVGRTRHLIAIDGWIEQENISTFTHHIQELFGEQVVLRQAEVTDKDIANVPIKLKNHPLVEPFEVVTEMYGLPKYDEIDPTPFLMPFYLTFFGMMVADVGYGLILALVTGFVLKFLKPQATTAKNLRLFHWIGWSVVAWGAIYGSFFGYSLPYKLIDMNNDVTKVLVVAMIFGFIQMVIAFLLNTYQQAKRKDYLNAYIGGLSWAMIFVGIALMVVGNFLSQWAFLAPIGKWLAIINAVGIVIASVLNAKSLIGIGSGLYNLYGISSYFGDLVSYSRLMALGLSGASIAAAFNTIVEILPPLARFTVGVVLFIVLHLLNFGLSMLGGYVHGIRLVFVEFFGKFYEGGGKPFKPLNVASKYVKIKTKYNLEEK